VITVKGNQPSLHTQLAALPWRDVPVGYDKRDRGHGRTERRTLKVTAVARGLPFPHAAQAIQIMRRRTVNGKWSRETCYAVTSLTATQASPGWLAAVIRGHWGIEDRLHWVRDQDFDEDRSQIRTAPARRSWPACATWPSPSCGWRAPPASPPPCATTPDGLSGHSGRS
jgi:DDE family transposase